MRFRRVSAAGLLALGACSLIPPGAGKLTLNNPSWDRVNVEVVVTRRADCGSRGEGFISSRKLVMNKDTPQSFVVPDGATLCWRHDPNPKAPVAGVWSLWTKAQLVPGQSAETDL
jgi:hypothetical protein